MSAENKFLNKNRPIMVGMLTIGMLLMSGTSLAAQADRDVAKRIHDRLAGVPPTETVLNTMESCFTGATSACDDAVVGLTSSGDASIKAAYIAMENSAFYNVTLKNFATPLTNEAQSVFYEFNDYTATVVGMIRDNVDYRELLYGNIIYVGADPTDYSNSNNQHYIDMENNGVDLKDSAQLQRLQQTDPRLGRQSIPPAGVMTTRAAARAFFEGGTNRAMLRFTFLNHLCNDMEQVKDITRPSDRIRQDVSRSPGGDSRLFLNSCIGCHAGMDPLAQAFAYYEWQYAGEDIDGGTLVYSEAERNVDDNDLTKGTTRAQPKNLINSSNFEFGYVTRNDNWKNNWRKGVNSILDWDTSLPETGSGAESMGMELSHSRAFASCQARKVFKSVCARDPMSNTNDRAQINTVVDGLGGGAISMKDVFAEMASYCQDASAYTAP